MNKSDKKIVKKILDQLLENDGNTIIVFNPKTQIIVDKDDFKELYNSIKDESWQCGELLGDFYSNPDNRDKEESELDESTKSWIEDKRRQMAKYEKLKEKYGVFV